MGEPERGRGEGAIMVRRQGGELRGGRAIGGRCEVGVRNFNALSSRSHFRSESQAVLDSR